MLKVLCSWVCLQVGFKVEGSDDDNHDDDHDDYNDDDNDNDDDDAEDDEDEWWLLMLMTTKAISQSECRPHELPRHGPMGDRDGHRVHNHSPLTEQHCWRWRW